MGKAIYHSLKKHTLNIITYCDGYWHTIFEKKENILQIHKTRNFYTYFVNILPLIHMGSVVDPYG